MNTNQIVLFLGAILWVAIFLAVVRFIQAATKDDEDDEQ